MSVRTPTIEQLARDAVEIDDPETALRALTALRLELDAAEADLVRRALRGGASWSQVARSLGITKQAAHRKYRHLFEQPQRRSHHVDQHAKHADHRQFRPPRRERRRVRLRTPVRSRARPPGNRAGDGR